MENQFTGVGDDRLRSGRTGDVLLCPQILQSCMIGSTPTGGDLDGWLLEPNCSWTNACRHARVCPAIRSRRRGASSRRRPGGVRGRACARCPARRDPRPEARPTCPARARHGGDRRGRRAGAEPDRARDLGRDGSRARGGRGARTRRAREASSDVARGRPAVAAGRSHGDRGRRRGGDGCHRTGRLPSGARQGCPTRDSCRAGRPAPLDRVAGRCRRRLRRRLDPGRVRRRRAVLRRLLTGVRRNRGRVSAPSSADIGDCHRVGGRADACPAGRPVPCVSAGTFRATGSDGCDDSWQRQPLAQPAQPTGERALGRCRVRHPQVRSGRRRRAQRAITRGCRPPLARGHRVGAPPTRVRRPADLLLRCQLRCRRRPVGCRRARQFDRGRDQPRRPGGPRRLPSRRRHGADLADRG